MSDSKEYYYMRLKDNYFDGDKQRMLESKKNGYEYSTILLKLYLKSLKNDGCLKYSDKIPYDAKTLSTVTGHKEQRIKEALAVFQELDLIEVLDSGEIFMLDIQNFIGKTSTEGDRKRAYRKRISDLKSGHLSDIRPPEIEKESKSKIKIDAEITETKESNKIYFSDFSGGDGGNSLAQDMEKAKAYARRCISNFTDKNNQDINDFMLRKKLPGDLIIYAIDEACGMGKGDEWGYTHQILERYVAQGIKTVEAAQQDDKRFEKAKDTVPQYTRDGREIKWAR